MSLTKIVNLLGDTCTPQKLEARWPKKVCWCCHKL